MLAIQQTDRQTAVSNDSQRAPRPGGGAKNTAWKSMNTTARHYTVRLTDEVAIQYSGRQRPALELEIVISLATLHPRDCTFGAQTCHDHASRQSGLLRRQILSPRQSAMLTAIWANRRSYVQHVIMNVQLVKVLDGLP